MTLLGATLLGCTLAPFEPVVERDAGRDAAVFADAGHDAGTDAAMDAGPPDACGAAELCNGLDDDCDPATPDGADEPTIGAACDGPDDDSCEEGVVSCAGGALQCDDTTGDATETCNALDDDCDGAIDEETCPCMRHVSATGRTYQLCTSVLNWPEARMGCRAFGYELVTIEDAAEDIEVTDRAMALLTSDWWIGLHDVTTEGTYEWVSGSTATFRDWGPGQPNNRLDQDCVQIDDGSQSFENPGQWSDTACADENPFICEAP